MAAASPSLSGVVLEFPFVTQGIGRFGQPFGIISPYFNLDAGKVFYRAGCRVSQRLQQTEADQDRDVFRLEAKPVGGFSRSDPPRQDWQAQDFFAFGIHGASLVKLMATAATWVFSAAV